MWACCRYTRERSERTRMLVIMAGMNQKDIYAVRRLRSLPTSAAACTWLVLWVTIFHAVFPSVLGMLKMLGILVGMDQNDSTSLIVFFCNGTRRAGLLVTLHPAVCSLCRPFVVDNGGRYTAGFAGDDAHHVSVQAWAVAQHPVSSWTRMLTCPLLCSTDAGIDVLKTVVPCSCSSSIRSSRLCLATESGTHSAIVQSAAGKGGVFWSAEA